MNLKSILTALVLVGALAAGGCGGDNNSASPGSAANQNPKQQAAPTPNTPSALPDDGFKAEISAPDAPAKLRPGQKVTLQVRVKNASGVQWYARGGAINMNPDNKFYLSAANRWLDAGGTLVTNTDGRYGLPRDLKPGEEITVPLLITAPQKPGDYILELDLVQEQVAWFREKGSPAPRFPVKVGP